MFPGWTAEQLFHPAHGKHALAANWTAAVMTPAPVILSTGLRPYIEANRTP
jgi:hypothetical protein